MSGRLSPAALDHLRHPRNAGAFPEGDPTVLLGEVRSASHGDIVRMQVRLVGDRIDEIRFKAFGCSATIAASSLATELARGATVDRARTLEARDLLDRLQLQADKGYCAELAVQALAASLASVTPPGPQANAAPDTHDPVAAR